jgi:hypothetical protein
MLRIRNNEDKIKFLRDFLAGDLPNYDRDQPLMIMGSEESGKTAIINEILQNNSVHIVLLRDQSMRFHHAMDGPSGICAFLIDAQMWGGDFHFQEYVHTQVVVFDE